MQAQYVSDTIQRNRRRLINTFRYPAYSYQNLWYLHNCDYSIISRVFAEEKKPALKKKMKALTDKAKLELISLILQVMTSPSTFADHPLKTKTKTKNFQLDRKNPDNNNLQFQLYSHLVKKILSYLTYTDFYPYFTVVSTYKRNQVKCVKTPLWFMFLETNE
eukprot:Awhi_evm1s7018